jgi:8-oxo-dGTP diphosphatase
VRRVVSSPSVRCVRTVEPLAQEVGVEVERANELLEGSDRDKAVDFVQSVAKRKSGVVVCSHGDVIPELLRYLSARGMKLRDELRWPKGSAWELQWDGTHFLEARYHAPSE